MRTRFPAGDIQRVDLTAMIDVIFLLLIFWMMVARLAAGEDQSDIETPHTAATRRDVPRGVWVVQVPAETEGVVLDRQSLTIEQLRVALGSPPPPDHVLVRADAQVDAARVQAVLSALRQAGVHRVGLAVRGDDQWDSAGR